MPSLQPLQCIPSVRPIMGQQSTDDELLGLHQQPFMRLMLNLLSNSNADRVYAEQLLLSFSKNYPQLLCLKTSLLLCSPLENMRFTAAILLRQFFTPTSDLYVWHRLSPFCQFYLRIILLLSLQEEKIRHVANAKADTIAQLASHLVPLYPQYPELLRFILLPMAKNQVPILVEANLRIFSQIAKPLANILLPKIPILRSILSLCITHPTSSDMRVAAVSASCSLVQSLPPSKGRNKLQSLLHFFHSVILNAVIENELTVVPKVLELMIDFAGAEPNFIRDFVKHTDIVLDILSLAENHQLKEGTRHLALEFVITLAEARKPVPGLTATRCRIPLRVPKIFSVILEMLFDVGDDMAWLSAQPQDKELNQSGNYTFALECLGRLVFALGGNKVLEDAANLLPAYFIDPDWKKRHAALISLARISQGCSKEIDSESLFPGIALTAIGAAMDEFENPCIQASAAMALMNFIEKCNDDILKPYLHEIVGKLVLLLKQGNQMLQEGAVSALTTVAEAAFDQFDQYYDAVMPHLMHILTNATNKKHRMLLAKSADCIIVVGLSAGKDKFSKHAQVVMRVLISLQSSLDPYDLVTNYVLQATSTMCEYLEHGFLPYMDSVMEPLLKSDLLKPDFGIASADSIADVQYFDNVGTETARIKGKRIRLRPSILEEKALACNVLLSYIEVLKEHFFPWTKKVALVLAPLIKFKYHVEVRKVSARAMPELLNSSKIAIEEGLYDNHDGLSVKQMFGYMLPTLLEGLHKEWDEETCAIILESLNRCLELSARHLKEYQVRNIVEEMKYLITSSDARRRKRERIKTEDFHGGEALFNNVNEHEDLILAHIGECLTVLIETYKADFLPFFDELSMYFTPMLVLEESIQTRRVSLNVFIDLAAECGDAAVRYYDAYLPYVLVACNDDDPIIRQSGVYGVGICAEFGGSKFTPFVSEALAKLNNVILSPNALAPDYALAYDNAVSALGKICQFHRFHARAKAIATWLNCLPISHDLGEAEEVHEQLCSMVESSDRQLLGENNKHLVKIISLFTEILLSIAPGQFWSVLSASRPKMVGLRSGWGTLGWVNQILSFSKDLATEQTRNRMVKFLKGFKDTMSQSTFCATMSSLSNKHHLAFKAILKR